MKRPGSTQVGLAKKFFARYPWFKLQPRPAAAAWADNGPVTGDIRPWAVGTEAKLLIVYVPRSRAVLVKQLVPGAVYSASVFDPVTGEQTSPRTIKADGGRKLAVPAACPQTRLGGRRGEAGKGVGVGWAECNESHQFDASENGGTRCTRPTLRFSDTLPISRLIINPRD